MSSDPEPITESNRAVIGVEEGTYSVVGAARERSVSSGQELSESALNKRDEPTTSLGRKASQSSSISSSSDDVSNNSVEQGTSSVVGGREIAVVTEEIPSRSSLREEAYVSLVTTDPVLWGQGGLPGTAGLYGNDLFIKYEVSCP